MSFREDRALFQKALDRLLGRPEVRFPLETSVPETKVLEAPELLRLSLRQGGDAPLTGGVAIDDTVAAGQALATAGTEHVLASPVAGTVRAIAEQPDIRGHRKCDAVVLEPSPEASPSPFAPLDPETAAPDELAERVREAGILSSMRVPVPLLTQLRPGGEAVVNTVVVLAADRDPGVSIALELLRERPADASAAARLLGRIAGAGEVVLAVLEGEEELVPTIDGLQLLPLPAEYPETLADPIRRRLGRGTPQDTPVIAVETALAALDAVREGRVAQEKRLTLIGPDQVPIASYRVRLGTRIRDVLAHAGIEPGERDRVVAGGPMRGYSLFSLDGSIDAGVDALTVVPADTFPGWSTEPCVNCGRCIDICPVDLQVQLISRFAEFELFDRTPELDIDRCFECGLCAVVCTARRPLLQYIRLAKDGLEASA